MSSVFACAGCGARFAFDRATLNSHPELQPVLCPRCYAAAARPEPRAPEREAEVPPQLKRVLDGVLQRYTTGPTEGIFTDGACAGNPGPGGWAAVFVQDNQIVAQRFGHDPDTTNNRMELTALIAAYRMLGEAGAGDSEVVIWSDSQLCVNTFTQWAPKWEARGWKRKGGAIANLDLVKPLYELVKRHPKAQLRWTKAHAGTRWNEYVDALAFGQIEGG